MKVLVADKFEKSGIEGLKAAGCEVVFEPDLKDATLAEALGEDRRRRARRALDAGDRADDGRGPAGADRPRRRRLQHDRRQGGEQARHLRVELPGQELAGGGRAGLRPDPRARPAHPRQRRGPRCAASGTRRNTRRRRGSTAPTLGILGFGKIGQELAQARDGVRHEPRDLERDRRARGPRRDPGGPAADAAGAARLRARSSRSGSPWSRRRPRWPRSATS